MTASGATPVLSTMRPSAGSSSLSSETALVAYLKVTQLSARFPLAHGGPVQVGYPEQIGVDLERPIYGQYEPLAGDEVPMFWACGVTPQAVALASRPPLMITHSPGHMFVTDLPNAALAVL